MQTNAAPRVQPGGPDTWPDAVLEHGADLSLLGFAGVSGLLNRPLLGEVAPQLRNNLVWLPVRNGSWQVLTPRGRVFVARRVRGSKRMYDVREVQSDDACSLGLVVGVNAVRRLIVRAMLPYELV